MLKDFHEINVSIYQSLHQKEGYKIVFITNQNGLATGKPKVEDFRGKVEKIVQTLGVPLQLFAATAKHCVFRKPRPGFWEYLEKYKNGNITIGKPTFYFKISSLDGNH